MSTTTELEQIADAMMRSIEQTDLDALQALTHDDVRIWHSFDGQVQGKQDNILLISSIKKLGKAQYTVIERICSSDRIVQRHNFAVTTWDGSKTITVPVAIFMTVRDAKVIAIDEYADSRDVGVLIAAMQDAAA